MLQRIEEKSFSSDCKSVSIVIRVFISVYAIFLLFRNVIHFNKPIILMSDGFRSAAGKKREPTLIKSRNNIMLRRYKCWKAYSKEALIKSTEHNNTELQ